MNITKRHNFIYKLLSLFYVLLPGVVFADFDDNITAFSEGVTKLTSWGWSILVVIESFVVILCGATIVSGALRLAQADNNNDRADARKRIMTGIISLAVLGGLPLLAFTILSFLSMG